MSLFSLQPTLCLFSCSSSLLSSLSFASFPAVYNWRSEGQGHKRLHLPAWWCAGLCKEASSDVPANPTFRQTPPFVQEDHRLHTHGCTHDPRRRWTGIPCIIHGHRCVWIHVRYWFCILLKETFRFKVLLSFDQNQTQMIKNAKETNVYRTTGILFLALKRFLFVQTFLFPCLDLLEYTNLQLIML